MWRNYQYEEKNHINVNLSNQLLFVEPSIIEKKNTCEYEIRDSQWRISDSKFISQFNVTTIYCNELDMIIIGSTYMETLGTFILNMNNVFWHSPIRGRR
jgi:hypothetical protein